MVSTTFADSPGLNVLHSQDLVNWEIVSHAAVELDMSTVYDMEDGATAYRKGMWASSIRFNDGIFYILVSPVGANARLYHTTDPNGSWDFYQLDRVTYDPGLFFDDDGTGYIICGYGPQSIMTLNSTYTAIAAEVTDAIDSGGEGSHVVKRGSYYYLFNANPGVWPFQLRCARTIDIFGAWETGHICLTATTGGHQGAIVDLDENDNWFGFVHQDSGAVGRMPRLVPVFWENNWPVFGTPENPDVIADTYSKPVSGMPVVVPAASDEFSDEELGLQWQWNHNPDNSKWSLSDNPGSLRLYPLQSDELWTARNTLTQKGQGPVSQGVVKIDVSNMQAGDIAGFGTLGTVNGYISIQVDSNGDKTIGMVVDDRSGTSTKYATGIPFSDVVLYLRTDMDFDGNLGSCAYSRDGEKWFKLGPDFTLKFDITYGTFQGEKYAIFCYNENSDTSSGFIDVDHFVLSDEIEPIDIQRGRPYINAEGTTFVADNGNRLRGPFASTEWGNPPAAADIESIKEIGCNAVHLYAECFDIDYPADGSTAPGYSMSRIDDMVEMTRDAGLYLIMTIGNGANNGDYNYDYVMDFWSLYADRYKDETHVIYEIQNEPHAWSAPYPADALQMEADSYNLIRSVAPDSPILLFSFSVLGSGPLAVADIDTVSEAAEIDWSNAAVAFHGYAGYASTTTSLEYILNAGYPAVMTEFTSSDWSEETDRLDIELTSELERLKVSWATFQHIPPNFIGTDVTEDESFYDLVNNAGLYWLPDYGTWPVARGVYGNDGNPRRTTGLSGTLHIEAEDFDTGGQGIAYNDTGSENQGGQYRLDEQVDVEVTGDADGDYSVGWIENDEWLEYTIWVTEPGYYTLSLRVASPNDSGEMMVLFNGKNRTGTIPVPNTDGWQNWDTISQIVFLDFGRQKMRVEMPAGGFNLNWIELTAAASGPLDNGTYKIINRNSGMAAEIDASNNDVIQSSYTDLTTQKWNIQNRGAGQYSIVSASNGWSWNTFSDLGLAFWGYDGNKDRRFIITQTDSGYYRVISVNRGLSVETADSSTEQGSLLQTGVYSGGNYQLWSIVDPATPDFPAGLTALRVYPEQVNLNWTASDDAESYSVRRATVSGGPYEKIAANVTTVSYVDTDIFGDITYYYVVAANTGGDESLNSNESEAACLHTYLKFDELSGAAASDSSGNGWDSVLTNGPVWSDGVFANAIDLDGSNDYIDMPDGLVEGLSEITVSAWVNLDSASTWSRVFDFGTGTSNYMFLTPRGSSGVVRFAITNGSGEQQINGDAVLPTGQWTHVAVTLNGSVGVLYVDGVEVGRNESMTISADSLGTTTQNYIGESQWSDPYLNGRVDDFRIYNGVLTSSQIAELYSTEIITVLTTPTGLTAAGGNGLVELSWDANSEQYLAGYNLYRSTSSGGDFTLVNDSLLTVPKYIDNNVENYTEYYYAVAAYDIYSNESLMSDEVMVMPTDGVIVELVRQDFEDGFGAWVNLIDEDSDNWTLNTCTTVTPNTGPTSGADGSSMYAYLETSPGSANTAGDIAILESPIIDGYRRTMKFDYHMYGDNSGSLMIDVYDGSLHEAIWSLTGQQQISSSDQYLMTTVDLTEFIGPVKVRFRAVAAGGAQGDIAIDNIVITGGLLYGDSDLNAVIDYADLEVFTGKWLQGDCDYDLNGDCMINLCEFSVFAFYWLNE